MRKCLISIIAVLLAVALVAPAVAGTQIDVYDQDKQLTKSVVFVLNVKEYFVDNQTPGVTMDVAPFIENNRTFVPIRFLSNALGVTDENIAWESPTVTLSEPGFPTVQLAVGNKTIKSDGQDTRMDVSPLLRNARTFLPARFVAEALGYQVDWDPVNKVVTCWPTGTEKPDIGTVLDYLGEQPVGLPVEPVEPVLVEPVEPPVNADVINIDGKGEPVTNYEFSKYLLPTDKINWVTYDEFQNNSYEFGGIKTHGMRVTKDDVYITQTGGCGTVSLYEGGDVFRVRESSSSTWDKYEYPYGVVRDERDQYYRNGTGLPSCDITKVSHVVLDACGTFLAIENPLYEGGK